LHPEIKELNKVIEMKNKGENPDYLFEASWEVCNKVGGIYTVLSTKAHTLQEIFSDKVIFIGPDIWKEKQAPDFIEDKKLFADWKKHAASSELMKVKVGRWNVPGKPPVILVDFQSYFHERDSLYYTMWNEFQVNSMNAYGDYDESCIFAFATAQVIESFYRYYKLEDKKVIAQFDEWMMGMGALYIQKQIPAIATMFTTHATSIGRSIAGNNKALYAYLDGYNGDQMAHELNMEAKHSIEKQTAHYVDCFTTVSDITAIECRQLLDKAPDIVTPNGFERNFVPEGKEYTQKRKEARNTLLNVAEKLSGGKISPDALLVCTSGRYEYRNKGIDIYIEAMHRLRESISDTSTQQIVSFIMVPAWVREARADLKEVIEKNIETDQPMQMPFSTHWMNEMEQDRVLNYIHHIGFTNTVSEKVKIIFVPCYLDGADGIFNKSYYDLLIGMDVTVFPSYYEPWGYTPLESIAFGIPTITTNLAGFGLWAKKIVSGDDINEGTVVIERNDFNYFDVADEIVRQIRSLTDKNKKEKEAIKKRCFSLAGKAEWAHFISFYQTAFSIALEHAEKRKC